MKKFLFLLILSSAACWLGAKSTPAPENSDDRVACFRMQCGVRNEITIPDVDKYKVFKCDFHMHTVYADAMVSPKGRVYEAWNDGLDVICVSEHIGVHKTGIEFTDFNLVNQQAIEAAKQFGLIVIPGIEITRAKPFGHMNALFIKDASVISEDRYIKNPDGSIAEDEMGRKVNNMETLQADIDNMIAQGAFIQWNHPGWPDKKSEIFDIQKEMISKGQIHAMEICNHSEWYPKVLDYFDQYHIPLTANSDQHSPSSCDYGRVIRPMNLVLAEEYTLESIKEAMFAGRIVAFWDQTLAGDAKWVEGIAKSCLKVRIIDAKKGRISVTNVSDIQFETQWGSHMNPVIFYPHSSRIITLKKGEKINFTNCYTGRKTLVTNLW